jgi:hypothetical protein
MSSTKKSTALLLDVPKAILPMLDKVAVAPAGVTDESIVDPAAVGLASTRLT